MTEDRNTRYTQPTSSFEQTRKYKVNVDMNKHTHNLGANEYRQFKRGEESKATNTVLTVTTTKQPLPIQSNPYPHN